MTIRQAVEPLGLSFLIDESAKFMANNDSYLRETICFLRDHSNINNFISAVESYIGKGATTGIHYMVATFGSIANANAELETWLENILTSPNQEFCRVQGSLVIVEPFAYTEKTRGMLDRDVPWLVNHLSMLASTMPGRTGKEFRIGAVIAIEFLRRFEDEHLAISADKLRRQIN